MKILEINKFYYLRRGAERHMIDVVELLESKHHDVAVFTMKHPKTIASAWEKFFVSYVGYNKGDSTLWQRMIGIGRIFWSFEARKNIRALLQSFRPDIVHLHNIYHQISPSILTPLKQSGALIVMTVHDYSLISPDKDQYYESVGQEYWKFLRVKKYSLAKRMLLVLKMYIEKYFDLYFKTIDIFVAPSQLVKDTLIRGGMQAHDIVVIPHFIAHVPTLRTNGADEKYALYCGSISKEKGIVELVRIFSDMKVKLVLAGSLEGGFILPSSEWIEYLGQQSRDEVEALMREAVCVVSGSQLPETFGLIALEAMSFGKPFFGLKSGAFVELVENGKNGFLADDFDGLEQALLQFTSGDMKFDASFIQSYAVQKYGASAYYAKFMALAETKK